MSDPMKVGRVEFNRGESYGLHPTAPPKPPKRVAVQAFGLSEPFAVANDGTLWHGEWVKKNDKWAFEWTRLPDLPQD